MEKLKTENELQKRMNSRKQDRSPGVDLLWERITEVLKARIKNTLAKLGISREK